MNALTAEWIAKLEIGEEALLAARRVRKFVRVQLGLE